MKQFIVLLLLIVSINVYSQKITTGLKFSSGYNDFIVVKRGYKSNIIFYTKEQKKQTNTPYSKMISYNFGVCNVINLYKKNGVGIDFLVSQKGSRFDSLFFDGNIITNYTERYNYIEIPVYIRIAPIKFLNLDIGVTNNFLIYKQISKKIILPFTTKNYNNSLFFGIGCKPYNRINFAISYNTDISFFANNPDFQNPKLGTYLYNHSLMLSIAYFIVE